MRFSKLIWRNFDKNFGNFSRHPLLQTKDQRNFLISSCLLKATIQRLKIDTLTWWISFKQMKIISIRNRSKQFMWFNERATKQSSMLTFIELQMRIILSFRKWCFKCSKKFMKILTNCAKHDKNIWISSKILKKSSSRFIINLFATINYWNISTKC